MIGIKRMLILCLGYISFFAADEKRLFSYIFAVCSVVSHLNNFHSWMQMSYSLSRILWSRPYHTILWPVSLNLKSIHLYRLIEEVATQKSTRFSFRSSSKSSLSDKLFLSDWDKGVAPVFFYHQPICFI